MRSHLLLAVAMAGALQAAPALAWDNDAKAYPATFCGQSMGTLRFSWTRAYNPSSSSAAVAECPILNDELDGIKDARVFVIDNHYFEDATCTLYQLKPSRTMVYEKRSTTASSGTPQTLSLTTGRGYAFGESRFNLTCSLPPRFANMPSWITGYRVDED